MPIVSLPVVGNVNYFRNGQGDGVIILLLALVSLGLALRKKYAWILTTGVASLALLLFTFVNLRLSLAEMQAENRGIFADLAAQSIQLQWGWAWLVVGAVLLIARYK